MIINHMKMCVLAVQEEWVQSSRGWHCDILCSDVVNYCLSLFVVPFFSKQPYLLLYFSHLFTIAVSLFIQFNLPNNLSGYKPACVWCSSLNVSLLNMMCLHVSKLHIRSGFSVYTTPSERYVIPANTSCSWGPTAQTQRPLSLFSIPPLSSLSSLSSSSDPYPAWRALCFIWPAGLLCSPLHATTTPKYSFNTQTHIISMCSRRQLHQIEHVPPVGGGECFPTLWHCQACKQRNTILQFVLLSSEAKQKSSVRWQWG